MGLGVVVSEGSATGDLSTDVGLPLDRGFSGGHHLPAPFELPQAQDREQEMLL